MKVLVKDSIAWGRSSYGKGLHDLPPPIAKELIKAGLATELITIDTSQRNVVTKDNDSIDNVGRKRNRSKKPVQDRSHG